MCSWGMSSIGSRNCVNKISKFAKFAKSLPACVKEILSIDGVNKLYASDFLPVSAHFAFTDLFNNMQINE